LGSGLPGGAEYLLLPDKIIPWQKEMGERKACSLVLWKGTKKGKLESKVE
jgi:hypothetical protein